MDTPEPIENIAPIPAPETTFGLGSAVHARQFESFKPTNGLSLWIIGLTSLVVVFNIGITFANRIESLGLLSLLLLSSLLANGIVTAMWTSRSYHNVGILKGRLDRSSWQAAGMWFIPFANLVIPRSIVAEISRGTPIQQGNQKIGRDDQMINLWWGFWIAASILGNFERLPRLSMLLLVLAGVMFILVVRNITYDQTTIAIQRSSPT